MFHKQSALKHLMKCGIEIAAFQNHMRSLQNVCAHMWFNLAAAQGDANGVKNRDIVAKQMTTQQIAAAQKLARECKARNYKNCN